MTVNLRGVITDADLEALRMRNASRTLQMRDRMGERWCAHPANQTPRRDAAFPIIPGLAAWIRGGDESWATS